MFARPNFGYARVMRFVCVVSFTKTEISDWDGRLEFESRDSKDAYIIKED